MNANGSVFKYPDNVDTDVIIPARYLNTPNAQELATHCMEDIDKEFHPQRERRRHHGRRLELRLRLLPRARPAGHQDRRVFPSSSPRALPASSTATAINIGLPIMECPEAVDAIHAGDNVTVDFDTGVITDVTTGKVYPGRAVPAVHPEDHRRWRPDEVADEEVKVLRGTTSPSSSLALDATSPSRGGFGIPQRFPVNINQFHRKRNLFAKGSPTRKDSPGRGRWHASAERGTAVERMRDGEVARSRT